MKKQRLSKQAEDSKPKKETPSISPKVATVLQRHPAFPLGQNISLHYLITEGMIKLIHKAILEGMSNLELPEHAVRGVLSDFSLPLAAIKEVILNIPPLQANNGVQDELLTINETAAALHVSESTIHEWIENGEIAPIQYNRDIYFLVSR